MKDLLKQAVNAIINEDPAAARVFYAQYFQAKSKAMMEDFTKGYVHGHCDDCGQAATTKQNILDDKKWHCGNCESSSFAKSGEKKESDAA